jgi:hypothetical protein
MADQRLSRAKWALRLLERPGVADAVAEALLLHDHRCYAKLAAEHVLEAARYPESEFLKSWYEGRFDA